MKKRRRWKPMALPWHSGPKALHECTAKDMNQQHPQGPNGHGHHAHHKPGTAQTQTLSPFRLRVGRALRVRWAGRGRTNKHARR